MSRHSVFTPDTTSAPGTRRLGGRVAAVVALAGLVSACTPAASEQLDASGRSVTALSTDPGDAESGRPLFEEQCSVCHAVTAGPPKLGPTLEGVLRRPRLQTGRPATEPVVREIVLDGSGAMPAFRGSLTDEQLDHLVAYLKTL